MRSTLHGHSGVLVLACVRTWPNMKFQQLANAKLKMLVRSLILLESPAIRVLGAVSCSVRRAYRAAEVRRFDAARKCARLLGCCGFSLPLQLRYLRQFPMSKVNFGWVARAPTWTSSKQLWSCCWSSVRRCRYSSPWLRCLSLGGNLHLDIVWATRLLSAVFRYHLSKGSGPVWSRHSGTASNALRSWMKAKGFSGVRPWVWHHAFAAVTVDASLPLPVTLCCLCLVLLVMPCAKLACLGLSGVGVFWSA